MERKVKYDYAFKLECVELVTEHYSCASVSNKKDTSESNIPSKWVGFYREYGKVGCCLGRIRFIPLILNKKYFYQLISSLSLREACLKFNIPTNYYQMERDFANFGLKVRT
jgi:transposase